MGWIILIGLGLLGYPVFVAWLFSSGTSYRTDRLEREVADLRNRLAEHMQAVRETEYGKMSQEATAPASPTEAMGPPAPPERDLAVPAPPVPLSGPPEPEPVVPATMDAQTRQDNHEIHEAKDNSQTGGASPATSPEQEDAATTAAYIGSASVSGRAPPNTGTEPDAPAWLAVAKRWLLTGNVVAKMGLVILFIGVAFLLKYVAATVHTPIEVRLAATVLANLALLGWGWRLRATRRDIGLPVQGTAIAILMLVIFGAYQRYDLIPAGFAFALLISLTAFTCILALLQNALWLAAFGIAGGFASPLLVSTGQGNHIALFSYYALLNVGVFALAIKRSWRLLNLLGFGFTFTVGTIWGWYRYVPEDYLSAQCFLVLFFLLYVAISLAFARKQQIRFKDYVDATLVLGTPLLAFGLQTGLMKDKPFGLALSALALSAFYLALALHLLRRDRERWRVLVETYVVLGTIFATLAIPLALDGRWTSAAWALEGTGFIWFGLRRQHRLMWMFGLLLQVGAALSFVSTVTGLAPAAAPGANLWLGFLMLAMSSFTAALAFRRYPDSEEAVTSMIAAWSITIAAAWLLAGWWKEASLHCDGGELANWLVAGALVTAALMGLLARRLAWALPAGLSMMAQLAGGGALVVMLLRRPDWLFEWDRYGDQPLLGTMMIALAGLATAWLMKRFGQGNAAAGLDNAFLAWGTLWWFQPVLIVAAAKLAFELPTSTGTSMQRWAAMFALCTAASAFAFARLTDRLAWPQLRYSAAMCWVVLLQFTGVALWMLYVERTLPATAIWFGWLMLWLGSEYLLHTWRGNEPRLNKRIEQVVHTMRTAGPWFAIWPAGAILLERWLNGIGRGDETGMIVGWAASAAWSNYLPTWAMMAVLVWLSRRADVGKWPTARLDQWYRVVVIPCGVALVVALAVVWNINHNGSMEPLPYLPLLNPLDLTTGFALLMVLVAARPIVAQSGHPGALMGRILVWTALAGYAWFNLVLLRSASQYLDIPYRFDELAGSQFVQTMLSLAWSATSLILMSKAATYRNRRLWLIGAMLLAAVVGKLFLADLAGSGSIARIVSFLGVGMLMVLIGYLAPYPKAPRDNAIGTQDSPTQEAT